MRVQDSDLRSLRAELQRRDAYAHALGQAVIEHELARARILSAPGRDLLLRIGAAAHEFDGVKDRHMAAVARSMAAQRAMGEAALRRLGLDPGRRELTIDLSTGDVLELLAGAWAPVAEAA